MDPNAGVVRLKPVSPVSTVHNVGSFVKGRTQMSIPSTFFPHFPCQTATDQPSMQGIRMVGLKTNYEHSAQ
ncbi:hypothetical protein CLAIMM_00608 [Cladophialophora immunda]|nr:hypothetical protein CLAIMM_00608 [Cladophialophora immunda]